MRQTRLAQVVEMIFFRRLALHRFVKTHPSVPGQKSASHELVATYKDILPAALLELWRKKGLGFYGAQKLALIDPRPWQSVLDNWISPGPDGVPRIPIALTSFGTLVYYRKLTQADEDVASIDPVSGEMHVLAWNLLDFFNQFLCQETTPEPLFLPDMALAAAQECGQLAPGEVYEIDQPLLAAQVLKITKVNALAMHQRLCNRVFTPKFKESEPKTVADALPAAYRTTFHDIATGFGLAGLYLSSYMDGHRLLVLQLNGEYSLLFWRIDYRTFERTDIRNYQGQYEVARNHTGDDTVMLNIELRASSLGSDANDEKLVAMRSGGQTFLLRESELEDMASDISDREVMGRSEYYFRRVTRDEIFPYEPSDGRPALPYADLPQALQTLIHLTPLLATITYVADPNIGDENEDKGIVMCTLSLGEIDGLRMNMPLYSPRETGRQLKGWVWEMTPHACKAGITYQRNDHGEIKHGPVVGDVLTTRMPR